MANVLFLIRQHTHRVYGVLFSRTECCKRLWMRSMARSEPLPQTCPEFPNRVNRNVKHVLKAPRVWLNGIFCVVRGLFRVSFGASAPHGAPESPHSCRA